MTITDTTEAAARIIAEARRAGHGRWASLAKIATEVCEENRVMTSGTFREAVKAASRQQGVHVVPEENQKCLTHADRFWAVKIGGKDNHLISTW